MAWDHPILALDLAGRMGWACGRPSEDPRSGSVKLGTDTVNRRAFYRTFRTWVLDFIAVNGVKRVVYETPIPPSFLRGHTNMAAARKLIGLAEHTEEVIPDGVELREATVGDVRRYFIGTSTMKGADAKLAVQRQCTSLGWRYVDDNASDALALWDYQCSMFDPKRGIRLSPLFQEKR